MTTFERQHVENMRVAQSKIHLGDDRWYVQTANHFVVRGPFSKRGHADAALAQIRHDALAVECEDC